MRFRKWTVLLAVVLAVLGLDLPAVQGAAADGTAAPGGFTFTDLGAGVWPAFVNNSGVVGGQYVPGSGGMGDDGKVAVWRNGVMTLLPVPDGSDGNIATVTDSGQVVGTTSDRTTGATSVVAWPVTGGAARTVGAGYNALKADEASGNVAVSGGANGTDLLALDGHVLRTLGTAHYPGYVEAVGPASVAWLDDESTHCLVEDIASGTQAVLANCGQALAPDGTLLEQQAAPPYTSYLRSPDGTETALPINGANHIDANHDVASLTQYLAAGAAKPIDLLGYVPSNWTNTGIVDMSNNGILVGYGYGPADSAGRRTLHGFTLTPQLGSISGQVLRGAGPNKPFTPAHAAANITVSATGRTTSGATVRTSDVTDSAGRYSLDTPPGTYTVTFPAGVCASVKGSRCVTATKVTVTAASPPVLDATALAANLAVSVKLTPSTVALPYDTKTSATEPRTVAVTMTVKNTGVRAATRVWAPATLTRSYNAVNVVKVPQIPVTQTAGPVIAGKRTTAIGTLAPGKAKTVTYALKVTGDGVYDIEGLVLGTQTLLGRVAGVGRSTLKIGAPVLVMHLAFGRGVKGVNARALLNAGTPFTIAATLENRSYTKTLFVHPPAVHLEGNAAGGVFVAAGASLYNPQSPNSVMVPQYFTIAPRRTIKAEIVVRTSRTSADVQNALGGSVGGTHAQVEVSEPVVNEVTEQDEVGARVPANQVFTAGHTTYDVGLDDSSMRVEPEPKTALGYALAITNGTFGALWNLTIGGAIGLFDGLKTIATSGVLLRLPRSIINYLEAEAALWNSIREGPSQGQFLDYFDSWLTLAYVHASGVSNSLTAIKEAANAALVAHLNTLTDDYYNGDWRGAVTELSKEGGELAGTLVLGTGLLTRWKPAAEAYEAARGALFTKWGEALDALFDSKPVIGAADALSALSEAVTGYQFNYTDLAKLFGLSESQAAWLLKFCKEQNILVTLRSRAAESLFWLNERAAVLKPEQIKIKTVSWLDAKWLGYGSKNVGRVIIRPKSFLPTESKLIAKLRAAGLTTKDAEYQEAITRLRARLAELAEPASHEGYAAFLEDAAKKKELTLRWNLEANSVDPSVATNGYTTYEFRLAQDAESGSGNFVAQFKVNGTWRSVTGDVDLLSIVGADGQPLSAARRVAIYQLIAKGPLGLMHPAVDTWTELTKVGGKIVDKTFSFAQKLAEMDRGTAAQFAPDLQVRAVTYNAKLSSFGDADSYKVVWNGGYNQVAGLPAP